MISEFMHDERRFTLKYYQIVDEAPLQLVVSTIVH